MNPPASPMRVEMIQGKLGATVTVHDIPSMQGPVPCWVYMTEGFRSLGKREIVFVLRRLPHEAPATFPHDPIHLFSALFAAAEGREALETGFVVELRSASFLGNPNLRGVGLTRMYPHYGLPVPADTLLGIGLFGEEVNVARLHGLSRVMSRLGHLTRQYPCPPWCERDRPPGVSAAWLEQSMLSRCLPLRIPAMKAYFEGNMVVVIGAFRGVAMLGLQLQQLPMNQPFALLCEVDPRADACFSWEPGQWQPVAITPPGSSGRRISGSSLVVCGDQAYNQVQIVEDGFSVFLTAEWIQKLRYCLTSSLPITFPASGPHPGLALVWDANAEAPNTAGAGGAAAGALFMNPNCSFADIVARMAPGAFDPWADSVEAALHRTIKALPTQAGQDLWLSITLFPGGHCDVQLKTRPGLHPTSLQGIYDALLALPRPPVTGGPVGFRGVMALWGGSGDVLDPG